MTLRTISRRASRAALVVFVAGGLSACGGDDTSNADANPAGTTVAGIQITNATDLNAKPGIEIPDETPPSKLVKEDIVTGTGETVNTGEQLTARYVGKGWGSNQQFDASWDRPEKEIPFTLADGSVISGWVEGLRGMKVGGRRLLIIPPDKGYGAQGQPPTIAGNETLVFVVDAKKVEPAPATPAASAGDASTGGLSEQQIQEAIQGAAQGAGN